jgi:hypothetical protein
MSSLRKEQPIELSATTDCAVLFHLVKQVHEARADRLKG